MGSYQGTAMYLLFGGDDLENETVFNVGGLRGDGNIY